MRLDLVGLRSIDLNKLIIFITIHREASVSTTASILGLTQPAVSNVLSELRTCFGDRLFVRRAGGMRPTKTADAIAECLTPVLTSLSLLVEQFKPDKLRRL